jgi:hypothetical protein
MEAWRNQRIEGELGHLYLGEMVMTRARRATLHVVDKLKS